MRVSKANINNMWVLLWKDSGLMDPCKGPMDPQITLIEQLKKRAPDWDVVDLISIFDVILARFFTLS